MRHSGIALIALFFGLLSGTGHAFEWTRTWAPTLDLSAIGPVGVGDIRVHGSSGVNSAMLAAEIAAALKAEGYVEARMLHGGEKASGIAVELTGSAVADTETSYGSTPVQREYWVTRDVTDDRGRTRSVQQREYRTEYLRTETLQVRLTLTLTAVHVNSGTVLGTIEVTARDSQYWQEDYGWRRSWDTAGLVSRLAPEVADKVAREYSPYDERMQRRFRPERNAKGATKSGMEAAEAGDYERALQLFTQALSENPKGKWDIYGNLAMVYEAMGRLTEAQAALDTGLAQSPKGGHDLQMQLEELERVYGLAPLPVVPEPDAPAPLPEVVPETPAKVHVIRLEGDQIFLDAGLDRGWTSGMLVALERHDIITGLDGEVLGEHRERIGQAALIEVYERYAVARVLSLEGDEAVSVGLVAVPIEATAVPD